MNIILIVSLALSIMFAVIGFVQKSVQYLAISVVIISLILLFFVGMRVGH